MSQADTHLEQNEQNEQAYEGCGNRISAALF
jgi:hypothetical protein